MKWGRVLLGGILTHVATLLVIVLVVTVYAFKLAFAAHAAPDQSLIAHFAESLSRSVWWLLQVLLTVPASMWAVRKVPSSLDLHGMLLGAVVATIGLAMAFTLSVRTLLAVVLTVGAGRLGAALVAQRRARPA